MAYDVVDDPLVDALTRESRDEGVTKNVPALQGFSTGRAEVPALSSGGLRAV
jgi:hypothetical protein